MALCILLLLCTGALATSTAETKDAVDASNRTLKTIPKDLPKNITKLILSNNFIELSSSDMDTLSKYQGLTELTLDSNLITTLPDKLLSILPALTILNLSHNNISVMEHKALSGQASLIELDLSHNHIASLPPQLLTGLTSLKRIHLQGNSLQTLEKDAGLVPESLQQLSLEDNPWECSCEFVSFMKWMNSSGLLIHTQATCLTPQELHGKSILNDDACSLTPTQAPTSTLSTTTLTSTQSSIHPKSSNDSHLSKDSAGDEAGTTSGGVPSVGNTWKLLVGVVVIALSTSVVIVCAVKSPSWYKLLFNYRHQRLREEGGPNVWATGRYSNFSLETEQTETSARELEEGLDYDMQEEEEMEDMDEDGFIEDRYIEPGDYKDQNES